MKQDIECVNATTHKFDKLIGLAKVMIISTAVVFSVFCLSRNNG